MSDVQHKIEANRAKADEFLADQEARDAADPDVMGRLEDPQRAVVADLGSAEEEEFPGREPEEEPEAAAQPSPEPAQVEGDPGITPPADEGVTFVSRKKPQLVVFDSHGGRIGQFDRGMLTVTNPDHIAVLDANPDCFRVGDSGPAVADPIGLGEPVRVDRHFVSRPSPYEGQVGMVIFAPPDGRWPYVVAIPDGDRALSDPGAPWPTCFTREEIERIDAMPEIEGG